MSLLIVPFFDMPQLIEMHLKVEVENSLLNKLIIERKLFYSSS